MTLQQAIEANLKIQPGQRIATFGGWCRRDTVLLDGHEIGRIQIRRGKGGIEITTIAGNSYVRGYHIDWLVEQLGKEILPARRHSRRRAQAEDQVMQHP